MIVDALEPFAIWQGVYEAQLEALIADDRVSEKTRKIMSQIGGMLDMLAQGQPSCNQYTQLSDVYIETFRVGMTELRDAFREKEPQLWADWLENNHRLWTLCRQ